MRKCGFSELIDNLERKIRARPENKRFHASKTVKLPKIISIWSFADAANPFFNDATAFTYIFPATESPTAVSPTRFSYRWFAYVVRSLSSSNNDEQSDTTFICWCERRRNSLPVPAPAPDGEIIWNSRISDRSSGYRVPGELKIACPFLVLRAWWDRGKVWNGACPFPACGGSEGRIRCTWKVTAGERAAAGLVEIPNLSIDSLEQTGTSLLSHAELSSRATVFSTPELPAKLNHAEFRGNNLLFDFERPVDSLRARDPCVFMAVRHGDLTPLIERVRAFSA